MEDDFDARDFYDKVAHIYDAKSHPAILDPDGAYQQGWAALVSTLEPRRILEIGCGTGRRLNPLVRYYRKAGLPLPEIVGVDPAPRMLEMIPDAVAGRVSLVEAEDTSQFADESFDLVVTSGVLCSTPEPVAQSIAADAVRISSRYIFHTDTPKDGPHLNNFDLLAYHLGSGLEVVYWSTIYPYPMAGEEEHQIILRKVGSVRLPDSIPLRASKGDYETSWRELLERRLAE